MEGPSLDDGHLCRPKLQRGVSVSIETGMSVMVESGNVVPDIVHEGRHAMLVAGALCTEVRLSWETELAHFLAANEHFPNLHHHTNAHTQTRPS